MSENINDFMRLGSHFGFVKGVNDHTIAHELGHGVFRLPHVENTKNLMSYGGGDELVYKQWQQIQNPDSWLKDVVQDEEEGAMMDNKRVASLLNAIKKANEDDITELNIFSFKKFKNQYEGSIKIKDTTVDILIIQWAFGEKKKDILLIQVIKQ